MNSVRVCVTWTIGDKQVRVTFKRQVFDTVHNPHQFDTEMLMTHLYRYMSTMEKNYCLNDKKIYNIYLFLHVFIIFTGYSCIKGDFLLNEP